MADGKYMRLDCAGCGLGIEPSGKRGRPRRWHAGCAPQPVRPPGTDPGPRLCPGCDQPIARTRPGPLPQRHPQCKKASLGYRSEYSRYVRPCSVDGCDVRTTSTGPCRKHRERFAATGSFEPPSRRCERCRRPFLYDHKRRFCSLDCRVGRKYGTKAKHDAAVRRTGNWFKCEGCGKACHRAQSSTNINKGYVNRFCSMQCRKDVAVPDRTKRLVVRRLAVRIRRIVAARVREAERITRVATEAAEAAERKKQQAAQRVVKRAQLRSVIDYRNCAGCGRRYKSWLANKGSYCKEKCRPANRRSRAVRKARARGATVGRGFDPHVVFERDGWRCQICGVSTPRSRRGTNHFNAPELDHVVPLSRGGEHSVANAQCTCRRCNGIKSDRVVVGQVPLFEAAPRV